MDTLNAIREWLQQPLAGRLIAATVALLVIALLRRLARRALNQTIEDRDSRYRLRKVVTFVSFALSAVVVLGTFSDRLGGLTVALGVAGAGIAFALQEVIASLAGWLALAFGGFYKVGDRVQLGGIKGDVIDIGVLRTTLMECGEWVKGDLYTGRVVRVANSFVFKEPVHNYSGDFALLWDQITIPIKYGSDRAMTRAMIERVAAEVLGSQSAERTAAWQDFSKRYRVEDTPLDPVLTMVGNDNWMEYTLRYAVHYRSRRAVTNRLFERLLDEVDASGGKIGIASATFHLVEAPPLEVRIRP